MVDPLTYMNQFLAMCFVGKGGTKNLVYDYFETRISRL